MPDDRRSIFPKKKAEDTSMSRLFKSFSSMFEGNKDQEAARQRTLALTKQVELTRELISKQRGKLEDLSGTDPAVAEFLKTFDNLKFDRIADIGQALEEDREISAEQGKEVVDTLENIQKNFGNLEFNELELTGKQMLKFLEENIENEKLSREFRASSVKDFVRFLESRENLDDEQLEVLRKLKGIQSEGLTFNKEQNERLGNVLGSFKKTKVEELKSRGRLDDINNKMGSFLTNQEELTDTLENSDFGGESLKEMLEKGFESGGLGEGAVETMFAMMGLPGMFGALTTAGGIFGKAGEMIKNTVTKVFGKGGLMFKAVGMLKAVGGVAATFFKGLGGILARLSGVTKILASGGRLTQLIPGVGQLITGIIALFSGITGFLNADEISGKKEEALTIMDKFQAALANIISTFTFGFVGSAEDIFKWLEGAKEDLSNIKVSEVIDNTVKMLKDIAYMPVTLLDQAFEAVMKFAKDFDASSIASDAFSGVSSFFGFGGDDDVSPEKEEPGPEVMNQPKRQSGGFQTTEEILASPRKARVRSDGASNIAAVKDDTALRQSPAGGQPSQVNVMTGAQGGETPVPPPARKRSNIDDFKLSALNLGLVD